MKTLALLFVSACAFAQTSIIYGPTAGFGTPVDFSAASSTKPAKSGTGAPVSTDCDSGSEVGREYVRTDANAANASKYVCVTGAGGTIGWELLGSGGGGGSSLSPVTTVSYSATPTFTVPSASAIAATFKITLTGNVTSSTLASAVNGQVITIIVCQDATGGRSFVWPANVVNGMTINSTRNSAASLCVTQSFTYDGTNAVGPKEIGVDGSGNTSIDQSNQIAVASLYPTMPTTATLTFPSGSDNASAGAGYLPVFGGANTVLFSLYVLESKRVFTKAAVQVGTSAVSGKIGLGIYSVTSGPTCTRVAQFSIDASATGVRTATIAAVTLEPGVYLFAAAGSSTSIQVRWWLPDNGTTELTAMANAFSVPSYGIFTSDVMDGSGNMPLSCASGLTGANFSLVSMGFGN